MTVTVKDHNELQIQTPTGPFTLYLDNVRAACTSNATKCDAELHSFVSRSVLVIRLGEEGKAVTPETFKSISKQAGLKENL